MGYTTDFSGQINIDQEDERRHVAPEDLDNAEVIPGAARECRNCGHEWRDDAALPVDDGLIADYVLYYEGARDAGYNEPMPFSEWREIEAEVRRDFENEAQTVGFEP